MWNFPTPLHDELLYSTIARAGLHHGIQSPKHLLDQLFQDRKVVATVDLPSHLNTIVHLLQRTGRFSLIDLIYKHTMFGLYAPFIQESHRLKAIHLMADQASGSVHLMLGLNASRVPNNTKLRYCPICIKQQRDTLGEYFWNRTWFLPNLSICMKHNCSLLSQDFIQQRHRHRFLPLLPNATQDSLQPYYKEDFILGQMAVELLQLDPQLSPSHQQWTKFYMDIADAKNFRRGNNVCHERTHEQINTKFNTRYLHLKNLNINLQVESSWLKSIFRKHRKSFSFFEHLVVWSSFVPDMSVQEVLQYVNRIQINQSCVKKTSTTESIPNIRVHDMRKKWQDIVLNHGIKAGRNIECGNSTYSWLYRNDNNWLLTFNSNNAVQQLKRRNKVNWGQRDLSNTKQLFQILHRSIDDLSCKRMSKSWFLTQLQNGNSISKNLDKLPLVSKFLKLYSEDIADYQIRRITNVMIRLQHSVYYSTDLWRIFRLAGLTHEKITEEAQNFLKLTFEKS